MVILRLSRPTALLTASVFEEMFTAHIGSCFDVRRAPTGDFCRALLGAPGAPWSLDRAAERLRGVLDGVDFFSPDYEATLLAPLFLAARNRARAHTRLLVIAHSPGAWPLEWAVLAPLLGPGDTIVAPSRNAADLITFLDSRLRPFVSVVPHPMAPLPPERPESAATGERVVSLGRLHPSKLLHRQIEAVHLLHRRGHPALRLEIAGPAETPSSRVYLASLQEKVRRLRLTDHVRFVGAVHGREAKARFLGGARALLNLSVSLEESFGKSPIEALGLGVPVLGTRWNGLPETIGDGGRLVPVGGGPHGPADVDAEAVAAELERLLDAPPSPETCRRQAERFAPAVILPRYDAVLEAAREVATRSASPDPPADTAPAASGTGLLVAAAPLTTMTWADLFAAYLESCRSLQQSCEGGNADGSDPLRAILLQGTRSPVERFLGGRPETPASTVPTTVAGDLLDHAAAAACGPAALSTRIACLTSLWRAGRVGELRRGLERLEGEGRRTPAVLALRAEEALLSGDRTTALERAGQGLEPEDDDEVTAFRLRRLASLARTAGCPERALPRLSTWLARFPDSPDSGPLWLDLAVNAVQVGAAHATEARFALSRARALLGDVPLLDKVENLLRAGDAAGEHGP
jgi:glycosyltransferase involved in cell wall biosynthesis